MIETFEPQAVLADNAYDADVLFERLFARLKQFRRIATRYDNPASRFASFIELAACDAPRTTRTRALLDRNLDPLATFFNSPLDHR